MLVGSTVEEVTLTEHVADLPLPSLALQVIVAEPTDLAVTKPDALTVATLVLLEDHETLLSVALFGETVADNCFVLPTVKDTDVLFKETLET